LAKHLISVCDFQQTDVLETAPKFCFMHIPEARPLFEVSNKKYG